MQNLGSIENHDVYCYFILKQMVKFYLLFVSIIEKISGKSYRGVWKARYDLPASSLADSLAKE